MSTSNKGFNIIEEQAEAMKLLGELKDHIAVLQHLEVESSIAAAENKEALIKALHQLRNYLVKDPEYQHSVLIERESQRCRALGAGGVQEKDEQTSIDAYAERQHAIDLEEAVRAKRREEAKQTNQPIKESPNILEPKATQEVKDAVKLMSEEKRIELAAKYLGLRDAHFRGSGAFRGSKESEHFRTLPAIRRVDKVTAKLNHLSPDRERVIAMLENYIITKEPGIFDNKILTDKRKAEVEKCLNELYDPSNQRLNDRGALLGRLRTLEGENGSLSMAHKKSSTSGDLHKLLTSEIEKLGPPKQTFSDKMREGFRSLRK